LGGSPDPARAAWVKYSFLTSQVFLTHHVEELRDDPAQVRRRTHGIVNRLLDQQRVEGKYAAAAARRDRCVGQQLA
jgi:hypothetical protein